MLADTIFLFEEVLQVKENATPFDWSKPVFFSNPCFGSLPNILAGKVRARNSFSFRILLDLSSYSSSIYLSSVEGPALSSSVADLSTKGYLSVFCFWVSCAPGAEMKFELLINLEVKSNPLRQDITKNFHKSTLFSLVNHLKVH